ncbi:MAG: MFS transporter, partial [Chloroflexota bacterium]
PATPADPVLTTDATGEQGLPPGQPDHPERRDHGRLYGFRAFRSPGFRIYFVGMLFRGMAMWMPLVAIPWLAVQLGATPGEVGIVTAFFFLPTLFIGPMGGVLADRVERRRVLVISQLFASFFAAVMFLLIVAGMQSLAVLSGMSFAFGMLIAIEVPVRQAFMTELVPKQDIPSAASLHATAWNTTRLFGPVLAGIMIATTGSASPFLFGAVVSLVVAGSVIWMDRYREKGRHRADRSQSVLEDLREGAAFVMREPVVRWSMILLWAAAMFGIATFITLAPIFAPQELNLGADGYGAFIGASGAGALTAALLLTAFAHGDRRPWLIAGVFAMAVLIASLAVVDVVFVAMVISFLLGAAQITLAQNALVSVQSATPDMLRGRVMGIWVMTFQASSLFGAILSGWLAEVIGVRGALFSGAMALAVVGLIAAYALRRVNWQLRPASLASA